MKYFSSANSFEKMKNSKSIKKYFSFKIKNKIKVSFINQGTNRNKLIN